MITFYHAFDNAQFPNLFLQSRFIIFNRF